MWPKLDGWRVAISGDGFPSSCLIVQKRNVRRHEFGKECVQVSFFQSIGLLPALVLGFLVAVFGALLFFPIRMSLSPRLHHRAIDGVTHQRIF